MSAKMCQAGRKALMSNPNKALGKWILRTVLKKKEGELVTMHDLNLLGIDSVIVRKHHGDFTDNGEQIYSIQFSDNYESYERFIAEE